MNKVINIFKLIFFVSLAILIILSLFPGSLLGYLVFQDFGRQPSLVDNPLFAPIPTEHFQLGSIINHFIFYFYISMLGFCLYFKNQNFEKIAYTLFLLSIILEALHFIIPRRAFEIYDVSANFIGVLIAYLIVKIYKFWRKL